MIYNFGNNIKSLRKERNLTQEQLAEYLNVSSQAISKWETNCSFPDITLLPIIASFFEISIDGLVGHDLSKINEDIESIAIKSDNLINEGKLAEAVSNLRFGLTKYPANDILMYKLAWSLSHLLNEDKCSYDEAIQLYLKILEVSKNINIKTKAIKDLVYRYYTKNDIASATKFANMLPSFDVCQEYNIGRSNILSGDALAKYLKNNIKMYGNAMIECLEYFTDNNILTNEEKTPYTSEIAKKQILLISEIIK